MRIKQLIARGGAITLLSSGATLGMKLASNVILTRLLAPEIFGLMAIVNSIRTGITLTTDLGVGQSIVVGTDGEKPDFYNTAWTLNLVRGVWLGLVCALLGFPLSAFYGLPELATIFQLSGLLFVINSLASVSPWLLQRRLAFGKLSIFEVVTEFLSYVAQAALAYVNPTIWALVYGGFIAAFIRLFGSYLLDGTVRHRFKIARGPALQILRFGRWIFLGAVAFYLATNVDRLFLGKIAPLELFGVYAISRSLSEPIGIIVSRISRLIVFPAIAWSARNERKLLRQQLASTRLKFALAVAAAISIPIAFSDILVRLLFDERYYAASFMLPQLLAVAWVTAISDINESVLLGLGKPGFGAIANSTKLACLMAGIPLGFTWFGITGVIAALAAAEICRYVVLALGQFRESVSFVRQDLLACCLLALLVGFWKAARSLSASV